MIIDCLLDALHDSIKLVPFLLLTYFLMEELEHHTGGKVQQRIRQAGNLGPLWGGILGIQSVCRKSHYNRNVVFCISFHIR